MNIQTRFPARERVTLQALALCLVLALVALTGCAGGADAHRSFATPQEAAAALISAAQTDDLGSLRALLGPGSEPVIASGDPVQDAADRKALVAAYGQRHSVVDSGDGRRTLVVGQSDWPLPMPLVQDGDRWRFDGAAGAEELVFRRVGANELGTIAVMRGYVEAQREYAAQGHDGDPPGIYALKLISDPGLRNGLYWESAPGEAQSPAGPFVAGAAAEGYRASVGGATQTYHGYRFRMLYAQGPNANGGAREYFEDGLLTGGFALLAWPAEYGVSGVQTFIVNGDGVVFQKDLGPDTAKGVLAIDRFDPDQTWIAVAPEQG